MGGCIPLSTTSRVRIDGDDDDKDSDADGFDEELTEAEREAREERWNCREVKDCPDLLQLARGVLPTAMLQIYYRSRYRELIGYSNAAFYKGDLNVPARHPEAEVRRVRPVEVIRADGVYEKRTNAVEPSRSPIGSPKSGRDRKSPRASAW